MVDYSRSFSTDLAVCINNIKNTSSNNILSLIRFSNGSYSYVLSAYGFGPGVFTKFFRIPDLYCKLNYLVGSVAFLRNLPLGSIFFNLPNQFFSKKGVYSRSAGTYCILLSYDKNYNFSKIKLTS